MKQSKITFLIYFFDVCIICILSVILSFRNIWNYHQNKYYVNDVLNKKGRLQYGDVVTDYFTSDLNGNLISIARENKQFKFIQFIKQNKNNNLTSNYFKSFSIFKDSVYSNNLECIVFIVSELNNGEYDKIKPIQDEYPVHIGLVEPIVLKNHFNLPECKCAYSILLDSENRIRFAIKGNFNRVLALVVKKEMNLSR